MNRTKSHTATRAELEATTELLNQWAGLTRIEWNVAIDEARARLVMTDDCFEHVVARGANHCEARAAGMWDANEREYFQAYKTAARVARERAGK